jgi:hypothetical protein
LLDHGSRCGSSLRFGASVMLHSFMYLAKTE